MENLKDRSARLQKSMTLKNLFSIIFSDDSAVAARYLEGDTEKTVTYGQYREKAFAIAKALREKLGDEQKGAFIGLQLDTCPEWMALYWGIIAGGFNALLLDATLNDEKTAYLLSQAGARALICGKKCSLPGIRVFSAAELTALPPVKGFEPNFGTMTAMCTSGTTATSRIFVYDEKALCSQTLSSEVLYNENKRMICDEKLRNLAFLPLHHVFGFLVCIIWMGFVGFENVYLKDRSPGTIQDTARRFQITHLMAVPILAKNLSLGLNKKLNKEKKSTQRIFKAMKGLSLGLQSVAPGLGLDFARNVLFKKITDQMLGSSVRCVILGGSHTPEEHMRNLSALGYYTVSGFGMTETGVTSLETSQALLPRITGSVGRPLTGSEYKVIPSGSDPMAGEMCVRGKTLHTGRLRDGKLLPPDVDAEGWYHTGDIVRMKKDGRMYVEGRAKDVIINESGENVYPDEIEEAFSVLEGPEQICVLGTPKKDGKNALHEDITLVMNLRDNWQDETLLASLSGQIKRINETLPSMKRVTRVLTTDQPFEVAGGIKIKRQALKKEIIEGGRPLTEVDFLHSGSAETLTEAAKEKTFGAAAPEEMKKGIRALYAEALDIPESDIRDDAHFIDELGGDSLQVLGMSLKIEEKFGVTIPPEDFGKCVTINDLSAYLTARINGQTGEKSPEAPMVPITRFEDSPEYQAFAKRQEALMGEGSENPYFVCHDSPLTDTSIMAGQKVLNFGSYNYVGMSGRKETMEAAKAAIDKYGTSASGSRLLAGEKSLYQELEKEIADWKHTETALVLVGGHSTNVTCVGNFCGKGDLIVYDALAHNSIEQGCRLSGAVTRPFPHNDVNALEMILRAHRHEYAKVLIVIEGAYSMDGDIAPVPEIVRVKKQYGCFLMVDEAHSACVIGETGGGVDEYFHLEPTDVDIKMGTLSKGLGACGGYLAGSRAIIDYMRYNLPGFVFSVGISPPLAAEVLCAIRLLRSDPSIMANMRRNIKCFVEEAHKRGFNTCLAGETAIVPILVGSDEDAFLLSNMLRKKGVFVPPAVYPAVPKGKARLRFCVISEHQPEQIIEALDKLQECVAEAGVTLLK